MRLCDQKHLARPLLQVCAKAFIGQRTSGFARNDQKSAAELELPRGERVL
jgi:hypothetical protein